MKIKVAESLYCINHAYKAKLSLESFLDENGDSIEGILSCEKCDATFPVIGGVAIIVENFNAYAAERVEIFGSWLVGVKSIELRKFLKQAGMNIIRSENNKNRYDDSAWFRPFTWTHYDYSLEDRMLSMLRWKIRPDEIYRKVTNMLETNIRNIGLDVGCSVGSAALMIAKKLSFVFGIDLSFSFISEARRRMKEMKISNAEFLVCDSTKMPFSQQYFDSIVALNLVGRLDLGKTIMSINKLIKPDGRLYMADPYDNDIQQTKSTIAGIELRNLLEKTGYTISAKNKKSESYIPWIIKINDRCYLFYFLDFIEARRAKDT
ncbi:MAG TPA: class I SAM-dependent methyltransferase [Nitrososphaeraceae archaeon]